MHSEQANAEPSAFSASSNGLTRVALTTFFVLFLMNMLDFVDRWSLSGVLSKLQEDLGINDETAGWLPWYFLVSYSLVSPLMGWAGDRYKRTRLLACGVALWSLATVGTGLSRNLGELQIARSLLGVGEASYGVLAPSILMDVFPRSKRARVLACFYLAMPLGYALGVWLGGMIAAKTGSWRLAFFVVGIPGLFAAVGALFLPEPLRGASEGVDAERLRPREKIRLQATDYRDLLVNSSYAYTVFGMAAFTFAFGGLAYWLPTYLERVKGFSKESAVTMVGLTGFFAALVGMYGGGWLADRLSNHNPRALFLVSGISMLLAVPFIVFGLIARETVPIVGCLFLAQLFMFANMGPCNAVIANVVLPHMRATAYAISTFSIHFLGDVWSPMLMGKVSDIFGRPTWMDSQPGRLLAMLGLRSVEVKGQLSNLGAGMLIVVPAVALGGLVLLCGMRHLPREMAMMQARFRSQILGDEPLPTPSADPRGTESAID